jgi:hypothetical protein
MSTKKKSIESAVAAATAVLTPTLEVEAAPERKKPVDKKHSLDAYNEFKQRGRERGYPKRAIELRWTKFKRGLGTIDQLLPARK